MQMKVHPLADIFPMMMDDELQELAADIKANGQLHPIIVDADGQVIDGRNRLAACAIAKVEPRFEKLNGHDAAAVIVSANLNRRTLSAGQKAMAMAMIYPEPTAPKGGRGKKDQNLEETSGFSPKRVQQARSILRYSPAKAQDVINNRTTFDKALAEVETDRRRKAAWDHSIAELRKRHPDLADEVETEDQLRQAEAEANHRDDLRRKQREDAKRFVTIALQALTAFGDATFPDIKKQFDGELCRDIRRSLEADARTKDGIEAFVEGTKNLMWLCEEIFK